MEQHKEKIFKHGSTLILTFSKLVKMTGMYDSMNESVLKVAKRLFDNLEMLLSDSGELTIKIVEGVFYIEGVKVKTDASDIEGFNYLTEELKKKSIGVLTFQSPIQTDDLIYLAYAIKGGAEASQVQSALESKLKKGINIGGPVFFQEEQGIDLKDRQAVAKLAYLKAVAAMKEMDASLKAGSPVNLKKIKKALQSIIDCMFTDEGYLLGFTTIRDVKNYYHHHAVNVTILAITLGKRLGLNRVHLSKLATAAFFHDIGKVEVPHSILDKKTDFTPKEAELIQMHPVDGVKVILKLLGLNETSIITMLVCFEHHMKLNFSGYPVTSPERKLNLFSRIVSIVDDYDSLVSGKIYERNAIDTEKALKTMNGSKTIYDPVLMKAFIGIFK